jgi:hypothetical protein
VVGIGVFGVDVLFDFDVVGHGGQSVLDVCDTSVLYWQDSYTVRLASVLVYL